VNKAPTVAERAGSVHPPEPKARAILATSDPVFAVLCARALAPSAKIELARAVTLSELIDAARRLEPDLIVLDADGEDSHAVKLLAAKVTLVTAAPMVLVSAYLAPGSPGLGALLQSVGAEFVQKPRGPSSLSLAGADGAPFAEALEIALAGRAEEEIEASLVDAGWDEEEEERVATLARGGS